MKVHIPVLVRQVLEYLDVQPGKNIIDCTVGEAGHTIEILKQNAPTGKVLGIDWDSTQIQNSRLHSKEFNDRVILVHDSYVNIKSIVENYRFNPVDGILADLGMSSWQLEGEKGFTFLKDQPLDMRYNDTTELTAEKIINEYAENKIEEILEKFGEEKYARHIAKEIEIKRQRKRIQSTFELVEIIRQAVPKKFQNGKIHVATKTFQALRIAVNGEIDNLEKFLRDAAAVLGQGGRLVIISFHSLEDRIVKNVFKDLADQQKAKILTKKPITGDFQEIQENPRARSAKLRVIEII
jgi:16S rRNA (cytosine1402-N4)-methyltransferase